MRKSLFLILAGLMLRGCEALAQPAFQVDPGEWIETWLLLGPVHLEHPEEEPLLDHLAGFETDYLKEAGGEKELKALPGQKVRFPGGETQWKIGIAKNGIVDLDEILSKESFILAYAYSEVISQEDRILYLALGTNDGGCLWFNGERVWDRPQGRRLTRDDDLIPVFLKKGTNTVLLKIEERGNIWGFCARFLPLDTQVFQNRASLFSIVMDSTGGARLRFRRTPLMLKQLFRDLLISVYPEEDTGKVFFEEKWKGTQDVELLTGKDYAFYRLVLRGTYADGTPCLEKASFAAGVRKDFVLFDGDTDYRIIIGMEASESEQWAAAELERTLEQVGGADFKVGFDTELSKGPEIIVGYNRRTRALLGDVSMPETDESFRYRNVGPHLVIWGGKNRGTLYGVMTFLERELGCRWYSPGVSFIPRRQRFTFNHIAHSEEPGLRVRNDFYFEAFDPVWAARQKVNGAMNFRVQPGGVEGYWGVHTFYRFVPPEEFYKTHPEYFSLIDGKRIYDRAQLCLTNPDVLEIVTGRVLETIRQNPEYLIYCVSQNDWGNPCQCGECQAMAVQEQSESGPLVWFVNRVAEKVRQEFPDKFIGTLAYTYTRKPCRTIKPSSNVVIRLCSIECCFAHDFRSCPENRDFLEDLEGWAAIAPHLYIWDYVVNFSHYIMPYPNFRVLQPNIQTFRDNNAIGIMEQAAYQSRGGEFSELRAYVLAKLLWDPECDVNRVIDDFMHGYYGRSGQFIREYFDLLHGQLTPDTHIHLGLESDDVLFSGTFIKQADTVFDRAETVADNDEIRMRVEMARLPLLYLKCRKYPTQARYDGTYERFRKIVDREGITHYAEQGVTHREAFHRMVESAR